MAVYVEARTVCELRLRRSNECCRESWLLANSCESPWQLGSPFLEAMSATCCHSVGDSGTGALEFRSSRNELPRIYVGVVLG